MSLKQIARDMKLGTFPNKSKDTLLEEAAVRIMELEAMLREITIHNDNIAKTILAALKEKGS